MTINIPTPELDKMLAVKAESQPIGEFLDWLGGEGIHLCTYRESANGFADGFFVPDDRRIEQLLADYFDIDLQRAEEERTALLDAIRNG